MSRVASAWMRWGAMALVCAALLVTGRDASAALGTAGFRAVGVAHAAFPVSAMAVAPDGRLFVAVQALGQTVGTTPGQAEIRVYGAYRSNDGAVFDEGSVWATVDGVRATTAEEGLLGLALAPDFPTSKLVYVYLTTTDENVNQHIRVYRENASGAGEYVGTVQMGLEPPAESTNRNGGPLTFGVDGCLYAGVGDNGGGGRWNAQVLLGTDPLQSSENTALCTNVCLGASLYPERTIAHNGAPNHAGKILRLAADGSTAAPSSPLPSQPYVFGAGMRNPAGLAVHPLTGQLYAMERGDSQMPEVNVVDRGSNLGWPCLEGDTVAASGVAACLTGRVAGDVYANHPAWRRPLATHAMNPAVSGIAAYTGLAYPAAFYGDVFYLLRDSARIYRLDLDAPCFLPHPGGVPPVAFHDSTGDGDFGVSYDLDGDGDFDTINATTFMALAQGPDPLGRQVLYVAGKQGSSSALTEDSIVFRIEYATAFTPYAGPFGRVADACFSDGVYSGGGTGAAPYAYENPFQRETCGVASGPCAGQADRTPCANGDGCHAASTCQAGACVAGAALADGTPCASPSDPCGATGTCRAGTCRGGSATGLGIRTLTIKREVRGPGSGTFALAGSITPSAPMAPDTSDPVTVELTDGGGVVFSETLAQPASAPDWRRTRTGFSYRERRGSGLTVVKLRQRGGSVEVALRGQRVVFNGLDDATLGARLVIGGQCFGGELGARCAMDARRVRCR